MPGVDAAAAASDSDDDQANQRAPKRVSHPSVDRPQLLFGTTSVSNNATGATNAATASASYRYRGSIDGGGGKSDDDEDDDESVPSYVRHLAAQKAEAHIEEMMSGADHNGDGSLSVGEIRAWAWRQGGTDADAEQLGTSWSILAQPRPNIRSLAPNTENRKFGFSIAKCLL